MFVLTSDEQTTNAILVNWNQQFHFVDASYKKKKKKKKNEKQVKSFSFKKKFVFLTGFTISHIARLLDFWAEENGGVEALLGSYSKATGDTAAWPVTPQEDFSLHGTFHIKYNFVWKYLLIWHYKIGFFWRNISM